MADQRHEKPDRIDLHIHLDGPITINVHLLPPPPPARPTAIRAQLLIGGNMPGAITVDTVGETAAVQWLDDKGDTDAAAPAGAFITYTSDNPAAATIDSNGAITPVAEGTTNIGATIADVNGNPILEPDGVTAFSVATVLVTVSAGAAVGAGLSLSV